MLHGCCQAFDPYSRNPVVVHFRDCEFAAAVLHCLAFLWNVAELEKQKARQCFETGVAWEFWRGRSYYLDQKTRDKARTPAPAPAPGR